MALAQNTTTTILKAKKNELDRDQKDRVLMTARSIRLCCEKEGLYQVPEFNEKLYLHFKGFHKIQNLQPYTQLKALWLNNNAISKMENLDFNRQLVTLYLNNNIITKIQGIEGLTQLNTLNLSYNRISKIEGLQNLQNLNTLNISHNLLTDVQSVVGLRDCPSIGNLDLSNNELVSEQDMLSQVFSQCHNLACLYLRQTPLARGFKGYRKRFVSQIKTLKFLDDRPVTIPERRLAEAWAQGGVEMENLEKAKLYEQREAANRKTYQDFQKLAGPPRERRRKLLQQLSVEKQAQLDTLYSRKNVLKEAEQPDYPELEKVSNQISEIQKYLTDLEEAVNGVTVPQQWEPKDYRIVIKNGVLKVEYIKEEIMKQLEDEEKFRALEEYRQKELEEALKKTSTEVPVEDLREQEEEFNSGTLPTDLVASEEKAEVEQVMNKWNPKYEALLEMLLEKHRFDFEQAYPEFNMAISQILRKLGRTVIRFEPKELREIWTEIEKKKRTALDELD